MEQIKNKSFGGERPLFGAHDVRLEDITITDGESGIKCCKNIECHHSKFYGKYPWWHVDGSLITDCYFAPESRIAICCLKVSSSSSGIIWYASGSPPPSMYSFIRASRSVMWSL